MSLGDVNPKILSLADRLVEPNTERSRNRRNETDDDDEALFAELEEEIANDSNLTMREHGIEILKREMERAKEMKEKKHGQYTELHDEKEVVRVTANEPKCIIHFYHSNFRRCEIMDKHLAKLAPKYYNTRFFRVFVENVPWLVERLGIIVLPCVITFVGGVSKDRLVGFEDLGNDDNFDTAVLELKLSMSGVIQKSTGSKLQTVYTTATRNLRTNNDNEEFDL